MKKISLATSILLALSMQVSAEPGKEGDKWIAGFAEYYSTDQEISGYPFYLSDGTGLGAEFGFRFKPEWAVRLEYSHLSINSNTAAGTKDQSGNRFGADALYFMFDDALYVFGGYKHFNLTGNADLLNIGVGKHWNLTEKFKVVTELAAYNDIDNGNKDIGVKLGLAYSLGESAPAQPKDSDNDGVNDTLDMCPNTPMGTQVDAKGCDIDADKDGVLNTLDLCPNTPIGTKVDSNGCNEDVDGDGVLNTLDACPNTPAGTPVGAKGCSLALDADEDGVIDSVDKCANTPITDKVDEVGCSIFMEQEVSQNLRINFGNNSSIISNPNNPDFQTFADFMNRYPNTDTVIEGHSSSLGNDDYNMTLSQKRADAVRKLLITKYGIDADRIKAVGHGETQLLDTANTPQAHALNRRITAKVTASKRVKVEK
jgi:OmpA-OmpF porin, OOP family